MMPLMFAAVILASGPVSLDFEGSLKDGIKTLAQKSEMNVMVVGDFEQHVEFHFPSISGEQALTAIAETHGLEVTLKEGATKVWIVRRAQDTQKASALPVAPPAPTPPAALVLPTPPTLPTPPAPPAPPPVGKHGRDKVSTGAPLVIEKGTRVKSAVAFGGQLTIQEGAVVEKDAVAFGGDVIVEEGARIEGNAVSFGGDVVRAEGAIVQGDSISFGGDGLGAAIAEGIAKAHRDSDEDIDVETHEEQANVSHHDTSDDDEHHESSHGFASFLLQFATFFGLGFLLMIFVPQRMKALSDAVEAEPGKNALAGLLGFIALAPLTVLLAVTIVGIPVALLLWLGVAVAIPSGIAVIANLVGMKVPTGRIRKTQASVLALGLFVVLLLSRIPVLGALALAAAIFISFGAIIRTRFGQPGRSLKTADV